MLDGMISPASREELIAKRASALMREEMDESFFTPWSPAWGDNEVAIRERCRKRAEDEVDAMHPVVGPYVPNGVSEDDCDWSLPPRDGLRRALAERDEAIRLRNAAAEVADRAAARVAKAEREVEAFADLDAQIENFEVQQARVGSFGELPYGLQRQSAERATARDRVEHARKAQKVLLAELRDAEQVVAAKNRVCNIWASRVVAEVAEELCRHYHEVRAEAESVRASLLGLARVHFAHSGLLDNKLLHEALNAQEQTPTPQELAAASEPWRDLHSRLLQDPDTEA